MSERFTMIFEGSIRDISGNPYKIETPHGFPVAAADGDSLAGGDKLHDELQEAKALILELADDLESEVEGHYQGTKDHPAMKPKYTRDMDTVIRARKFLDH